MTALGPLLIFIGYVSLIAAHGWEGLAFAVGHVVILLIMARLASDKKR
ncbi:MAG: hypothetical protein QM762_08730 [Chryseolinea sp.]